MISITCQADIAYNEQMLPLIIDDIFNQLIEDGYDIDFEELSTNLLQLYEEPININQATQNDLEQLYFLSDEQIDNILAFVNQKQLQSIYELRLVKDLKDYEVRNLLPFIIAEPVKEKEKVYWHEIWHYGKQDIVTRFDMRNPETSFKENKSNGQTEDPFYISLKYRFNYKNRIQFGLQMERDAGEKFYYPHKIYGADYYGGYLQIENMGIFQRIVLGDFNASFGYGLILNTNMGFGGKIGVLYDKSYRQRGLQRKGSTSEYGFLRGFGATARIDNVEVSAFYSARKIDGKINNDTDTFPTIIKTGYHRTESELESKRAVWQQIIGANATLHFPRFRLSFTATENILSNPLSPKDTYYNAHYFHGKRQTAISGAYLINLHKVFIFGEIAGSENQQWGFANLTGLSYKPISGLYFKTIYRYYSKSYDNLLGNGFAENSHNTDENGIYLGTELNLIRHLKILGYIDLFKFKEPKYGMKTAPSKGIDCLISTEYNPKNWLNMSLKIRAKSKYDKPKYTMRYMLQFSPNQWLFTTMFEMNRTNNKQSTSNQKGDKSSGFLLAQNVQYTIKNTPITVQGRFELFKCKNYDNRFYYYENDVLYAFSVPSIYGEGLRYYLNGRYKINNHISIYLKFGQTYYSKDWAKKQKMQSSHRTELHTLFRIKF